MAKHYCCVQEKHGNQRLHGADCRPGPQEGLQCLEAEPGQKDFDPAFDVTRLKRLLPEYEAVSLEQGIRKYIEVTRAADHRHRLG